MTTVPGIGPRQALLVARKDLSNEPLFFACLIFSIAAILVPLMFLMSVKIGFIDRLKEDFILDPKFRQIKPDDAGIKSMADLDFIRGLDGVIFLQPSVTFTPRSVDLLIQKEGRRRVDEARLIPTSLSDPEARGLRVGTEPEGDTAVLSADLAEKYGLSVGDELTLVVSRVVNDKSENVRLPLRISGVMAPEAARTPSIWVPSVIDQNVERYRAGLGVASRGWPAIQSDPKQAFDRMLITLPEPIGAADSSRLRIRFGSNTIEELDTQSARSEVCAGCTQLVLPEGFHYLLKPASGRYSPQDIEDAKNVVSDDLGSAVGLAQSVAVTINGFNLRAAGLPKGMTISGISLPSGASFAANDKLLIGREDAEANGWSDGQRITAIASISRQGAAPTALALPMTIQVGIDVPRGQAVMTNALVGMLGRAELVELSFDPEARSFSEGEVGFRGFRVIADDFESVPQIARQIEEHGVPVRAPISEIERMQTLERSLNLLVAIVGVVAVVGAIAILASSYFANVQRKITQFACLRLIGFNKQVLSLIPLIQAVMTGLYGFVLSVALFLILSVFSNNYVAQAIGFDARLSKFPLSYYAVFLALVLLCSMVSAFFAVRLATSTDPSGALK